ncbi:MAG: metal-dependent hydrolase [Nitrososphaerota archaeon]|nr:metal-dependent hydrolase [Nitrososphaerota archaeon]
MTSPTHIAFAESLYLLILTPSGVQLSWRGTVITAFVSLLPDIDLPTSWLGRIFFFISEPIERTFGHRTITHSLLFTLAITACIYAAEKVTFVYPHTTSLFLTAYVSHILLDTCTIQGAKMFYPISSRDCVFPYDPRSPYSYRMKSGSKADTILFFFFAVLLIPLYIFASNGFERLIRITQKTTQAAVRDYYDLSTSHIVFADIDALNTLTHERINGRFEIVGIKDPNTLLFASGTNVYTLGENPALDNFMSNSVVCIPGPQARTSVISVNLSGQLLSSLKNFTSQTGETRFFGSLEADQRVELPQNFDKFNTLSSYGSILKFDHATYDDILKLSLENTLILKGQLTIKTISELSPSSPGLPVPNSPSLTLSPSPRLLIIPLGDFSAVDTAGGAAELSVAVKQGDSVKAGTILAKIGTPSALKVLNTISSLESRKASLQSRKEIALVRLRSSVRSAEEKLENSIQAYNLKLDLYNKSLASRTELDIAEKDKSATRSNLDKANKILESTQEKYEQDLRNIQRTINQLRAESAANQNKRVITSPADGIVVELRSTPKAQGKISYSIVLSLLDAGVHKNK